MNVFGSKNKVMSRRLGQHHDVPESFNCNVATFGQTSRRSREVLFQRHDIAKSSIFNVVTFESNVATLQRSMFSTS